MNSNDDAKAVADLICFLQSRNASMKNAVLGMLTFCQGIVAYNLRASEAEKDGHSRFFLNRLVNDKLKITGWSLCECGQCWAAILDEPIRKAREVQQVLVKTAFLASGKPEPTLERLLTLPLSPPPPLPYLVDYIRLARRYKAFPEVMCSRVVYEGNQKSN